MTYEQEVIEFFEKSNIPLKKNVKFYFDNNLKEYHEIDIIIPGYLIEIKENFHFTYKSLRQIDKFYNLIPEDIKLCLICNNNDKVENCLKEEFPNIIVTNNPKDIKPCSINNIYYRHQNYLLNFKDDGYNNIFVNSNTANLYHILNGKQLDSNINVIESYPNYNDFYMIYKNKIPSSNYIYIISEDSIDKSRLFYHFYNKVNLSKVKFSKPMIHNDKYTNKCIHGIFFHKYPCKICME